MEAIALTNSKIKEIRSLHLKKFRDEANLFLVEGEKMVNELLLSMPEQVVYCVVTPDFHYKNHSNILFYQCKEEELKRISTLKTPNKVLAVVKKFKIKEKSSDFMLALDGVQDPGNMGTILRLADWFGIDHIICSPNTVDLYNPKVIQASMGAFLRVTVSYTDLLTYFNDYQGPVYGALLEGKNVYQSELQARGILLMGNEGKGISKELINAITHPVTIPRFGGAESLNVSVATGILLSEFKRTSFK